MSLTTTRSRFWGKESALMTVSRSPWHFRTGRVVLLAEGAVLTALGVWGLIVTGFETGAFFLLFAIGTVASATSDPGPLGSDPGDSVLHPIFMAVSLALLMWLVAETLEGPYWVPRRPAPTRTDAEDAP